MAAVTAWISNTLLVKWSLFTKSNIYNSISWNIQDIFYRDRNHICGCLHPGPALGLTAEGLRKFLYWKEIPNLDYRMTNDYKFTKYYWVVYLQWVDYGEFSDNIYLRQQKENVDLGQSNFLSESELNHRKAKQTKKRGELGGVQG